MKGGKRGHERKINSERIGKNNTYNENEKGVYRGWGRGGVEGEGGVSRYRKDEWKARKPCERERERERERHAHAHKRREKQERTTHNKKTHTKNNLKLRARQELGLTTMRTMPEAKTSGGQRLDVFLATTVDIKVIGVGGTVSVRVARGRLHAANDAVAFSDMLRFRSSLPVRKGENILRQRGYVLGM